MARGDLLHRGPDRAASPDRAVSPDHAVSPVHLGSANESASDACVDRGYNEQPLWSASTHTREVGADCSHHVLVPAQSNEIQNMSDAEICTPSDEIGGRPLQSLVGRLRNQQVRPRNPLPLLS